MHIHIHTFIIHIYICALCIQIHVYMCIYTYVYIHMPIWVHVYMCKCVYVYLHLQATWAASLWMYKVACEDVRLTWWWYSYELVKWLRVAKNENKKEHAHAWWRTDCIGIHMQVYTLHEALPKRQFSRMRATMTMVSSFDCPVIHTILRFDLLEATLCKIALSKRSIVWRLLCRARDHVKIMQW